MSLNAEDSLPTQNERNHLQPMNVVRCISALESGWQKSRVWAQVGVALTHAQMATQEFMWLHTARVLRSQSEQEKPEHESLQVTGRLTEDDAVFSSTSQDA